MQGFCQCMLVLEKLRDIYASADFAIQFLEATIHKAEIKVEMRRSRERRQENYPQALRSLNKVNEIRTRTEAAHRTALSASHASADFRIPANESDSTMHNPISARKPESQDVIHPLSAKPTLGFTCHDAGLTEGDKIDLNDFLTFDNANELWAVTH